MSNIQEILFQTIDTITESKINKLKFDKTIEAIVLSDEKSDVGEYELKYQDLIFTAYSSSNTTRFRKDDNVLVLIPDGDMSNRKTIVSSNKREGDAFIDFDEVIDKIGINFVDEAEDYEINLSTTTDETISFKIKKQLMIDQYPGQRFLDIGADLYTNINDGDIDGTYGIAVDCVFVNDNGERIPHTFEFTTLNVTGNPYQARGYKETRIPLLEERLVEVVGARAFSRGFSLGNEKIKMSKLTIEYVSVRDPDSSDYSGNILTPKGADFRSNVLYPDETLPLTMEFKQQGAILDTDAIDYKWFVLNAEVDNVDHDKYHPDAGFGWEWIRSDSYPVEMIKGAGTKTLEVAATFIPTFSVFKCVASYQDKGVSVFDMVTVTDHTEAVDVEIISSNGVSFINGVGGTDLTCSVTQSGKPLPVELDYEWSQIKEGGDPILIQKGSSNRITAMANTFGLKSVFICEVSEKTAEGETKRPIVTGRITLVNIHDGRTQGIVIIGGFRTVLYDADGRAPTNLSKEGFQFDVYDNGEKVNEGVDWTWSIPIDQETLLTLENAVIVNGIQTTKNRVLNLGVKKDFNSSMSNNTVTIEATYTKNGITSYLRETAAISITKVGNNGADGSAGKPGIDGSTYVYEIQGGSPTIYYNGLGQNPTPSVSSEFYLMFSRDGNNELAKDVERVEWEIPSRDTCMLSFYGKDPAVRRFTTTSDGTANNHTFKIVADSEWNEDKFNNYISAKITYSGMIFREVYPISITKNGEAGYTISTLPSSFAFNATENDIVVDNRQIEILFDVKDEGGTSLPFLIDSFSVPSGVGIVRNEAGTGAIFTILNDRDMPREGAVDFVLKVNSKRYFQTFTFSRVKDGTSPYSLTLISSNGLTFKRGDINTAITAFVMKGTTTIDPLTIQDAFVWKKTNKDGEEETGWVPQYIDGQKHIINITPDDILERATFECKLNL